MELNLQPWSICRCTHPSIHSTNQGNHSTFFFRPMPIPFGDYLSACILLCPLVEREKVWYVHPLPFSHGLWSVRDTRLMPVIITITTMVIRILILIYDSTILWSKNRRSTRIVGRILKVVGSYDPTYFKYLGSRIITQFHNSRIQRFDPTRVVSIVKKLSYNLDFTYIWIYVKLL